MKKNVAERIIGSNTPLSIELKKKGVSVVKLIFYLSIAFTVFCTMSILLYFDLVFTIVAFLIMFVASILHFYIFNKVYAYKIKNKK